MRCCVANCAATDKTSTGISFHRFPSGIKFPDVRQKWINFVGKLDWIPQWEISLLRPLNKSKFNDIIVILTWNGTHIV